MAQAKHFKIPLNFQIYISVDAVDKGQMVLETERDWQVNGTERHCCTLHASTPRHARSRRDTESSLFGLPNGLAPAPTGFFGLGLGFECGSKPKPTDRLGKPICRLGKPVCSLKRETGLLHKLRVISTRLYHNIMQKYPRAVSKPLQKRKAGLNTEHIARPNHS
ncbi:hypothetical protein C8R45DRAFT_923955 [Mycena sanguinolenta]|nr:hypothetical protein C8R45DRAFT_923955 [Mycena sanguinolenta]